ncbi:unnamed protein product [Onchocerca ochengi]|nr:unnamed protein product [Onchocerca ochengi]
MKIIEARINFIYYRWKYLVIDELLLRLSRPDMKIGKEEVPTLLHLCRLAIRKSFPASQLANGRFVENLPIPSSLKDYLRLLSL